MNSSKVQKDIELFHIVDPKDKPSVFMEIRHIISMYRPDFDLTSFEMTFNDTIDLYNGAYPGYMGCTTDYHNLDHTLETALAMARLIHGYCVGHGKLSDRSILLGIISALFHDSGYIQKTTEHEGTAARFSLVHIARSIEFTREYLEGNGFPEEDIRFCENCILCTNINTATKDISFSCDEEAIIGKMLGVSDLVGQISNRNYLENLALLYEEFEEGNVKGFLSERDLYHKTVGFFDLVRTRFCNELDNLDSFLKYHFQLRLNVNEDLYAKATEKNEVYLKYLTQHRSDNFFDLLRRDGIINMIKIRKGS